MVIAPGNERDSEGATRIGAHSKVARLLRIIPRRHTWREVIEFQPDVVFVQFAIAAASVNIWSMRELCKRCFAAQIPVVVAYHETVREYDLLGFVSRFIYRSMARVTNVPISFSPAGRLALTEHGLFNEVVELPHGTSGVALIADEDVQRVRELYCVQKPLVLTLGFTHPDKGTDVLLDAASAIAGLRNNEVQFLIAGSPRRRRGIFRIFERRDVAFQQRLEAQGEQINAVDVAFRGFVSASDVAALLFVAEVVALPYRKITQSGIANLALSSRAVVVSSDLLGLRSDLGDAAQYVEVGNSRELAERIAGLLGDDNASTRERMRELSAERALLNTFSNVAEKILSLGLAQRGTS
jgi:glycosyltransferase involved in cell wall biosynthesis